jgi:F-type H+-transporting ATPase subunit b
MRALGLALALLLLPDAALAAEGADRGSGLGEILWQALNLVILIAVIVYFARKPVAEYLAQRRHGIQGNLETSARLLEEAEAKLGEWNDRTARLDAELAEVREASRRFAEEEREEILAQARAAAERIRRDATAAVEQETRRARAVLSAEAAELAVELAARIIAESVSEEDQRRLFDEFLERIEAGPDGSGEGR